MRPASTRDEAAAELRASASRTCACSAGVPPRTSTVRTAKTDVWRAAA